MWGPLFWIGFSIGFVMIAWNILSYFSPGIPTFPTGRYWSGTLLYLGGWLYQAGISPPLILFLFFSCSVVFLVLARIVNETGFVAAYSPINPSEFVVCGGAWSIVDYFTGMIRNLPFSVD